MNEIDVDSSGNLYAVADNQFFGDAGIYKSTDNGEYWNRIYVVPTSSYINGIAIRNSNEMYYCTSTFSGTISGGIFCSDDEGKSWYRVLNSEVNNFCKSINGDLFACAENGLYKLNKDTKSWEYLGINSSVGTAVSLSNNQILAGTNAWHGILLKYTEAGGEWKWVQCTTGLPSTSYVLSLMVNSRGDILAGTTRKGIYYSSDNGDTWLQTSLTSGDVPKLLLLPDGKILAGTSMGRVYESLDNGRSWEDNSIGLPSYFSGTPNDSTDIYVDDIISLTSLSDGNIIAGTRNHGLYITCNPIINSITNSNQSEFKFILAQNYPNPFNPSTTINYQIPSAGLVTIKIYDVLGREIETLVNEEKGVGRYKVEFNGSNLASGLYFYRITSNNYSDTKKMVLVK